jgi:hypothetical protein
VTNRFENNLNLATKFSFSQSVAPPLQWNPTTPPNISTYKMVSSNINSSSGSVEELGLEEMEKMRLEQVARYNDEKEKKDIIEKIIARKRKERRLMHDRVEIENGMGERERELESRAKKMEEDNQKLRQMQAQVLEEKKHLETQKMVLEMQTKLNELTRELEVKKSGQMRPVKERVGDIRQRQGDMRDVRQRDMRDVRQRDMRDVRQRDMRDVLMSRKRNYEGREQQSEYCSVKKGVWSKMHHPHNNRSYEKKSRH